MPEPYDHSKNLAEARGREQRRELVICAVALGMKALICVALARRARGSDFDGLVWALAALFLLGAVHCAAHAIWFDQEDGR